MHSEEKVAIAGALIMIIFVILANLALLAAGVWVVVEVLQWTGVL